MRSWLIWLAAAILALPAWARASENIAIAGLFTLSGGHADVAEPSVDGLKMAVKEINSRGGVLGRLLTLQLYDTRSTAIGAKIAAEQAARSQAVAIIGPGPSSQALTAAAVAERERIPMLVHTATHPDITAKRTWVFRLCATDRLQGRAMAEILRQDLGAREAVLLLSLTSDYSLALGRYFQSRFQELGGEVVRTLYYRETLENAEDMVQAARAARADICFIPGHLEAGRLALMLQQGGGACIPAGGDAWGTRAFMLAGGSRLRLGYFCNHWSAELDREASQQFVRRYSGDQELESQTALAYDAVFLLADALRRAGQTDRTNLRDALEETRDFQGVTGRVSYRSGHDPDKDVIPMVIKDGRVSIHRFPATPDSQAPEPP